MTPTGATGMKMKRESLLSIPEKGILEKLQIPLKSSEREVFFFTLAKLACVFQLPLVKKSNDF